MYVEEYIKKQLIKIFIIKKLPYFVNNAKKCLGEEKQIYCESFLYERVFYKPALKKIFIFFKFSVLDKKIKENLLEWLKELKEDTFKNKVIVFNTNYMIVRIFNLVSNNKVLLKIILPYFTYNFERSN